VAGFTASKLKRNSLFFLLIKAEVILKKKNGNKENWGNKWQMPIPSETRNKKLEKGPTKD
jgi:hypothetical protein